jgi:leucyl aminopeptidase (aminopeptidase T)
VYAQAALYDELADLEPPLADEHRATAHSHRTTADDIAALPGEEVYAGPARDGEPT